MPTLRSHQRETARPRRRRLLESTRPSAPRQLISKAPLRWCQGLFQVAPNARGRVSVCVTHACATVAHSLPRKVTEIRKLVQARGSDASQIIGPASRFAAADQVRGMIREKETDVSLSQSCPISSLSLRPARASCIGRLDRPPDWTGQGLQRHCTPKPGRIGDAGRQNRSGDPNRWCDGERHCHFRI